eukprot:4515431-Ditylum_brightwellii.AAC.1
MQHRQHKEKRNTSESAEPVAATLDQMKPLLTNIYDPVVATPDQMENLLESTITNEECIPEKA